MIKQFRFFSVALLIAAISVSVSCKKVVDNPDDGGQSGEYLGNYTLSHSIYDSLYMYAKAFYLWNNNLPSFETFNPVQYRQGDSLSGLSRELFELTQIPINKATNKPYEYPVNPDNFPFDSKYSYILKTSDNYNGGSTEFIIQPDNKSFTLDGVGNDLGIHFGFMPITEDSTFTVLKYVENGSPAQKAGLKRGDIIYKMNGQAKSFDDFGEDDNARNKYYNDITDAGSLDIVKVDSLFPKSGMRTETAYHLKKVVYKLNPILKDTMINLPGGKKVAYLALETFTELDNAQPFIDAAFKKFAGATDLIVDLRYNGGGSVETAKYMANYIAPADQDGKTLFTMKFNDSLRRDNYAEQSNYSDYLKSVLRSQVLLGSDGAPTNGTCLELDYSIDGNKEVVKKKGNLELANKQVYFIVAGGTASASELLINSLTTHNKVTTVGARYAEDLESSNGHEGIRTYGKPVGFFDLHVGDYTVYMSMFQSLNSNNEGDYYEGMLSDDWGFDDIEYDFGQSRDPGSALNLILKELDPTYKVPGAKASISSRRELNQGYSRRREQIKAFERAEIRRSFKPMVRKRVKLK